MAVTMEDQNIMKELENGFKMIIDGDKRWEEFLNTTEKAVESYNYLFDQLNHVKRFTGDDEIEKKFPILQSMLISKICSKISEEIELLEHTRKECKRILDSLRSKQEKIISIILKLDAPCSEVSTAVNLLEESIACFSASYLEMTVALAEAQGLEQVIPKSAFAYVPSQWQVIKRAAVQWKFYST